MISFIYQIIGGMEPHGPQIVGGSPKWQNLVTASLTINLQPSFRYLLLLVLLNECIFEKTWENSSQWGMREDFKLSDSHVRHRFILRPGRSNWCYSSQLVPNNDKRNLITPIMFQPKSVSLSLALWILLLTARPVGGSGDKTPDQWVG